MLRVVFDVKLRRRVVLFGFHVHSVPSRGLFGAFRYLVHDVCGRDVRRVAWVG